MKTKTLLAVICLIVAFGINGKGQPQYKYKIVWPPEEFSANIGFWKITYNIVHLSNDSDNTVEIYRVSKDEDGAYFLSIKIPSYVTYKKIKYKVVGIHQNAFANLKELTKVVFPKTLKYIEGGAFQRTSIENVILPDSVSFVGTGAFMNKCIKHVHIPNSVTNVGCGAFYSMFQKGEPLFNKNIFIFHSGADSIYAVPEGIKTVAEYSLMAHTESTPNLKTVILPATVDSIGPNAVKGVKNLYVKSPTPPLCGPGYINSYNKEFNVFVPNYDPQIIKRYKADPNWNKYNIFTADM